MVLTKHDAEERSRQIIGRVMDAREKYSEKPGQSSAEELIHRQDDLIAELKEQVRILLDWQGPSVITTGGPRTDEERMEDRAANRYYYGGEN